MQRKQFKLALDFTQESFLSTLVFRRKKSQTDFVRVNSVKSLQKVLLTIPVFWECIFNRAFIPTAVAVMEIRICPTLNLVLSIVGFQRYQNTNVGQLGLYT